MHTQQVRCRIWILALRITMIGMSCPFGWPFHTPSAGCGAHAGVPLHSVRGFFFHPSGQHILSGCMTARRCAKVLAGGVPGSGQRAVRGGYLPHAIYERLKCLGISVAKVSEVLSLFILVVYRTAEPACGHPPSFGGFPNDGHPSHSTILVLKQIETNGDLGIPHFQKVPNYHIHRYSWMAFPQSQRIDKC